MTNSIHLPKIVIEGVPVTKKNSQQILRKSNGTPFIAPSRKYKQYEQDTMWQLSRFGHPSIDYPVNVRCLYYMPTRRAVDLVNLLEATCDILVKAGILKDDNSNIIIGHDGSRVCYDKKNPRTEIFIESVKQ